MFSLIPLQRPPLSPSKVVTTNPRGPHAVSILKLRQLANNVPYPPPEAFWLFGVRCCRLGTQRQTGHKRQVVRCCGIVVPRGEGGLGGHPLSYSDEEGFVSSRRCVMCPQGTSKAPGLQAAARKGFQGEFFSKCGCAARLPSKRPTVTNMHP